MPDHLGDDMRKTKVEENKEEKEFKGNCDHPHIVLFLHSPKLFLCFSFST